MATKPDFDTIPDEIILTNPDPKVEISVAAEIDGRKGLVHQRSNECKRIKPIYKPPKRKPLKYSYKFTCVCPRYNPNYLCQHSGNVILDRDVLTKEEHICYLATPKKNFAAPRKRPRFYPKKIIMPACTARIETLALPHPKRVKDNLQNFKQVLPKKCARSLKKQLAKKNEVQYTTITRALDYIDEERRLQRVKKNLEKRQYKRIRKCILRNQRKQIRKIICVLFEEMKDFLLNDQFLIDEQSTLCAVILEQIKSFTDKEFYTTSNLREYQQILANNLTVWINKFISNLNIQVTPPKPKLRDTEKLETFLPLEDYISCSSAGEDEDYYPEQDFYHYEDEDLGEFEHEDDMPTNP